MRKYLYSLLFMLSMHFVNGQSFYQQTITDCNNTTISTGSFSGKRVLVFVTSPQGIPSCVAKVDSIHNVVGDSLVCVVVPARELGFSADLDSADKQLLVGTGAVILQPGYVMKSAGASQTPIIKWLTDKSLNGRFNDNPTGSGTAFFISVAGNLYGCLADIYLTNTTTVSKLIHRTAP